MTEAYTTTSYISDRGNHITIRRPILTPEESANRMKAIKKATINLLIANEKAKQRKTQKLH